MKKIILMAICVILILTGSALGTSNDNSEVFAGFNTWTNIDQDETEIVGNYMWIEGVWRPISLWVDDVEVPLGLVLGYSHDWGEWVGYGQRTEWDSDSIKGALTAKYYDLYYWEIESKIGYKYSIRDGNLNGQTDNIFYWSVYFSDYFRRGVGESWFPKYSLYFEHEIVLSTDVDKGDKYEAGRHELKFVPYIYDWKVNDNKDRFSFGLDLGVGYYREHGNPHWFVGPNVSWAHKKAGDRYQEEIFRLSFFTIRNEIGGDHNRYYPFSLMVQYRF